MEKERFAKTIAAFDDYNSKDPNKENAQGIEYPKELLYAERMSEELDRFAPNAAEHIKLAARSQHIGRWEIPRSNYPMDKKGYLLWRSTLKKLHADIAAEIMRSNGYENETIERVGSLLLKRQLKTDADTQLIEDVVCLVFVKYYLEEFAAKHEHDKVIDIIKKTLTKMTSDAIASAVEQAPSKAVKELLAQASS